MWGRLSKVQKNIGQVIVSVDTTEETYLKIRKGGNWHHLLENLEFLNNLRINNSIQLLQVSMVVQKRNNFEMIDFSKMYLGKCYFLLEIKHLRRNIKS